MNTNFKHTFLPSTPHHLFLTRALISQKKLQNGLIIYFDSKKSNNANNVFDSLEVFFKKNNFQIIYLKDKIKYSYLSKLFKRFVFYKKIFNWVNKNIYINTESEFYFFNDTSPESQFFNYKFKPKTSHLVQDGITQFTGSYFLKKFKKNKALYYKYIFGKHWAEINEIGKLRHYKSLFCFVPQFALPQYSLYCDSLEEISANSFFNPEWSKNSDQIIKENFPSLYNLTDKDAIVFLPKIVSLNDLKIITKILKDRCQSLNLNKLLLKGHPSSNYQINEREFTQPIIYIPSKLPGEFFLDTTNSPNITYIVPPNTLALLARLNPSKHRVVIDFYDFNPEATRGLINNKNFNLWLTQE